jgi:glycosyl transferase family 25
MHVYVINMARASDRMAHMRNQLDNLGVAFKRIEAVDAKSMSNEQIAQFRASLVDVERHSTWSPGGIGCFLSHKKTWAEIAAGDKEYAAVFEDDVHLSNRIAPLLRDSGWVPRPADIVRFETTLQSMKLEQVPIARLDQTEIFKVHSGAWGAAGYVIRRDIAAWLACSPQRIAGQADWFLFHKESPVAQAMAIFQCDPAPCVQDQYHPDVPSRRNFDKVTPDPSGLGYELKSSIRRLFSPIARLVRGRRAVPFA